MNETTPFLQSWIFDLILLFSGTFFGFIAVTMLASSGQASRDEEWQELLAKCEKEKMNLEKMVAITKGKSDRD